MHSLLATSYPCACARDVVRGRMGVGVTAQLAVIVVEEIES